MTSLRALYSISSLLLFLVAPITIQPTFATEDWTQFRGTTNSGEAPETAKPATKWNLEEDAAWATEIPGVGWSSPVFKDGCIWLTTAITKEATPEQIEKKREGVEYPQIKTVAASVDLRAICVDLESGKILHDISLAKVADPELINPMNSYASPTAALADGKVVCHFGSYGTWCLDATTGETIWQAQYVIDHSVGPGSSPVIFGNKVILVCDGTDKQFVVGLDLASGKEIWRTNRPPMRAPSGEQQKAYCTPKIIEVAGNTQAVIPGAQWIASYEPDTGKEIWRADHGDGFSVTPMAVYESGLVIFSTCFGRTELVAVDPTGKGDVTKSHIKWRKRNATTMPSFVARKGRIFSLTDKGILFCRDASTGEPLDRIRVGGNFSASPLWAADNLYLSSREGVVSVYRCGDELERLATNKFASPILASPAVVGNDLLIRTERKLYRIKN